MLWAILSLVALVAQPQGLEDYLELPVADLIQQATHGVADAQFGLGMRLWMGAGIEQNSLAAVGWFEKAAAQEHDGARAMLAIALEKGEGVPQDSERAAELFERLAQKGFSVLLAEAEAGNPEAQARVGHRLLTGMGVDADPAEGVRWLERSAEGGHVDALVMLAFIYDQGVSVPEDHRKAYFWYNLATAAGHDPSRPNRDRLRTQLSSEVLLQLQEQTSLWWMQHGVRFHR